MYEDFAPIMRAKPFKVDILVYDGCLGAEAFAVADVLNMANALYQLGGRGRAPRFTAAIVSIGGRSVRTSAGATVTGDRPSTDADMFVVPGLHFTRVDELIDHMSQLTAECRHIKSYARRTSAIGSICVGAFLLAEAGVLDGRVATTGWIAGGLFKRRYPKCRLDIGQLLVRDGQIWTTGAVTAAYDLALALTRQSCGNAVADRLAKIILVGQDRTLQSPFVLADLESTSRADLVTRACHVMRRRSGQPYDLGELAGACRTSKRTLNRRFREEMQCSPLQFFHKIRIERAKSLLETTHLRLQELPERLGYADETTFRAIFKRLTGMTPGRYRQKFVRA
jgi:transcriptional regulator GlxA family with amidase domain